MSKLSSWLSKIIQELNEKEKIILLDNFFFLTKTLENIFGMQDPWFLIVDNQILNDLKYKENNKINENKRERYIRLISVFMIFEFLNNYSGKQLKIVLTPCIFYEFNQRKIPINNESHDASLDKIYTLIREFGIQEIYCFDIGEYKISKDIIKKVIHDEKIILKVIQRLKRKRMKFDLYQKFSWNTDNNEKMKVQLFELPILRAQKILSRQRMKLRYFDRGIVNHVIACHLEEIIFKDSLYTKELKEKFKGFRNMYIGRTASISKISNGVLKGLADIELIQYCNISSQFNYNCEYTLFALTFDKKLARVHPAFAISINA